MLAFIMLLLRYRCAHAALPPPLRYRHATATLPPRYRHATATAALPPPLRYRHRCASAALPLRTSAICLTASKSSGLAMGKPASMMSTPSFASCRAISSFSDEV